MVIDSLQKYTYSVKECVNMKKEYVTPTMAGERFSADEYVAACITGEIQCALPGDGHTNGDTTRFDDYNGEQSGWYYEANGKPHGLCGTTATISFNGDTGSGYEVVNGKVSRNRPIYNIQNYTPKAGTYYNVTWNSDDGDKGTGTYSHIGRLVITNIDNNHPNHS